MVLRLIFEGAPTYKTPTVEPAFHTSMSRELGDWFRLLAAQASLFGYNLFGHGVNLRQGLRYGKTRSGGSNLSGGSFSILPQNLRFAEVFAVNVR
jgi:hypothetical protein